MLNNFPKCKKQDGIGETEELGLSGGQLKSTRNIRGSYIYPEELEGIHYNLSLWGARLTCQTDRSSLETHTSSQVDPLSGKLKAQPGLATGHFTVEGLLFTHLDFTATTSDILEAL